MIDFIFAPFYAASLGEKIVFLILFLVVAVPMTFAFLGGAPFVPTPQPIVDRMLKEAKLKKGSRFVDPGCGDGRSVITAAKRYGAKATGYELFIPVYLVAKLRNAINGFPATIRFKNSRSVNYRGVNAVFCFLLDSTLPRWKRIWEKQLPKGARVVSYAFEIKGWKPIKIIPKNPEKNYFRILVYEIGRT